MSTSAWGAALDVVVDAAQSPVVIVGSLPPDAADVDVLVDDGDTAAVHAALAGDGWVRDGSTWLRLDDDEPVAVEVLTPTTWNLPSGVWEALCAEGAAIRQTGDALAPADHHQVLLAARRLAWRGHLGRKADQRARDAMRNGLELAQRDAPSWHAAHALTLLEAWVQRGEAPSRAGRARAISEELRGRGLSRGRARLRAARWVLPLRRRRLGAVIAVSGTDGSGKSTVVRGLRGALAAVGRPTSRRWMRLSHAPLAHRVAVRVKAAQGRATPDDAHHRAPRTGATSATGTAGRSGSRTDRMWATVLVGSFLRRLLVVQFDRLRGRLVVCDRYVLDAIVELEVRYGIGPHQPLPRVLLALAPRPTIAVYLDLPADVAAARQEDDAWSHELLAAQLAAYRREAPRVDATVVDASAPAGQVVTVVTRAVGAALARR